MNEITFTLNGKKVTLSARGDTRFLDILRKELGLTGPKEGCGEGECGACAVFVDDRLVNSCILPLAAVSGSKVLTIEGYRQTKRYEILETAFLKEGATQCGICTPGMIMAAQNILSQNAHPSEEEIREGLSGNLCRCTGYNMIVKAIRRASKSGDGPW